MDSQHRKNFIRLFNSLCGRHSPGNIWSDFITMAAISISNVVDQSNAQKREQQYQDIVSKYQENELLIFPDMLAELVLALDENSDQDFLGDIYMELGLNSKMLRQCFTPYNISRFMAKLGANDLVSRIKQNSWISVNDPTCGAGSLLIAFANECKTQRINYQEDVLFVAQDINYTVALMCYIQLSLLGCPGYVCIGDSISAPVQTRDRRGLIPIPGDNIWYTPFYYREKWRFRCALAQMEDLFGKDRP